jgi:hypothetical protein
MDMLLARKWSFDLPMCQIHCNSSFMYLDLFPLYFDPLTNVNLQPTSYLGQRNRWRKAGRSHQTNIYMAINQVLSVKQQGYWSKLGGEQIFFCHGDNVHLARFRTTLSEPISSSLTRILMEISSSLTADHPCDST